MASSILPVAKSIYLCDEVVEDPASRKVSLLGAFNSIREVSAYPVLLPRLCVVALLTDGQGAVPTRVEVAQAGDDRLLLRSLDRQVSFATRHTLVYACFRFLHVSFPAPGVYTIELYCQSQFVDDRTLTLPELTS